MRSADWYLMRCASTGVSRTRGHCCVRGSDCRVAIADNARRDAYKSRRARFQRRQSGCRRSTAALSARLVAGRLSLEPFWLRRSENLATATLLGREAAPGRRKAAFERTFRLLQDIIAALAPLLLQRRREFRSSFAHGDIYRVHSPPLLLPPTSTRWREVGTVVSYSGCA